MLIYICQRIEIADGILNKIFFPVSSIQPSFDIECSVAYDETTGLFSPSIHWRVVPQNLSFLVVESLDRLTIFYNNATNTEGIGYRGGRNIGNPSIASVGTFNISEGSLRGSISFEHNGTGMMILKDQKPTFDPAARQFSVSNNGMYKILYRFFSSFIHCGLVVNTFKLMQHKAK